MSALNPEPVPFQVGLQVPWGVSCPNDGGKQFSGRPVVTWAFHGLAQQKECQISRGAFDARECADVHRDSPKHAVASIRAFLKFEPDRGNGIAPSPEMLTQEIPFLAATPGHLADRL